MLPKILLVDGDELVLEVAKCLLEDSFQVSTARNGATALKMIHELPSFAAVVTDLNLPDSNGARFLNQVKQCAPTTSRLVLAGDIEFASLIEAVNAGGVLKLLRKPCPLDVMREALYEAVVRHGIKQSELQRLDEAMDGTVRALTEALAIINPTAFCHTQRIVKLAVAIAQHVGAKNVREIEWAASLSHLGCIRFRSASSACSWRVLKD